MYEFFMTYQWEMWAVAALVFLVLELMAGDFFMLCLAAGAVCSQSIEAFSRRQNPQEQCRCP